MLVTFGTSFVGKVDREGTETQTAVAGLQSFAGAPIPIRWASFGWGVLRAAVVR